MIRKVAEISHQLHALTRMELGKFFYVSAISGNFQKALFFFRILRKVSATFGKFKGNGDI